MHEINVGNGLFEVSHKVKKNPLKEAYANHIHTYCEVLLLISGEVNYNIDGQIYRLKPYDLLFIPKDTYHYLIPAENTVYENYVISFSADILSQKQYERIFGFPLITNVKHDKELLHYFTELDTAYEKYTYADFVFFAGYIVRALLIYLSYMEKANFSQERSASDTVTRIIEYINQNICTPLNSQIISDDLHLSVSHVQNIFSKKMNIGLKQYILQKKLYAQETI